MRIAARRRSRLQRRSPNDSKRTKGKLVAEFDEPKGGGLNPLREFLKYCRLNEAYPIVSHFELVNSFEALFTMYQLLPTDGGAVFCDLSDELTGPQKIMQMARKHALLYDEQAEAQALAVRKWTVYLPTAGVSLPDGPYQIDCVTLSRFKLDKDTSHICVSTTVESDLAASQAYALHFLEDVLSLIRAFIATTMHHWRKLC